MTSTGKIAAGLGLVLTFGWAGPALAYIGPGAGLSLLGALWAVVAAVLAALLFLLIWPLRRLLRQRRQTSATTFRASQNESELTRTTGDPRFD